MYEAPKKMTQKKKIELLILVLLIIWGILFIINYMRYTESKAPIFALHVPREYDDGVVDEYISLGYVYRSYKRNSISKEEFVPFWVGLENPEAKPDLPVIDMSYNVPENPRKEDKHRGLLYYYNRKGEFLGTYKCLNSSLDCNKAFSGYDSFNTQNKDALTKLDQQRTLGTLHDKFAFIDDSLEQDYEYGDLNYSRIVYLYRFLDDDENDPEILAKWADVKESTFDENYNLGYGYQNKYIVRSADNGKWGLVEIKESGTIEEIMPYEYDSITYDSDTDYYIVCKDGNWYIYDLDNDKIVSAESVNPIYNVWRNDNMTYWFKTGRDRTVGDETFVDYKIYRIDGKELLNEDKVTQVIERGNCYVYLTSTNNTLNFADYSGEVRYKLKLNFNKMHHNELTHPAFELMGETKGIMIFKVYDGRELKYDFETYSVNTKHWDYNE